jgi:hypothetical protein
MVQQFEISKIVDIDLEFQYYHNSVSPQFDSSDFTTKAQFTNTSVLMIIPNHNFVWRISRISTSTNQCENIASKQHLNITDASFAETSFESFLEWIAVVDAETSVSTTCKAAIILIEPNIEEVGARILLLFQIRHSHRKRFSDCASSTVVVA